MPIATHRRTGYLVIMALVLGACGGDADTQDQLPDEASSTTGAGTPTIAELPTALPNVPGISDECVGVANLMLGISQVFAGNTAAFDQFVEAAAGSLPGELADEIESIRGAALQYQAALEEAGVDLSDPAGFAALTPAQIEGLDEAYAPLQSAAVTDAFDAVGAYGEAECAQFAPGG